MYSYVYIYLKNIYIHKYQAVFLRKRVKIKKRNSW